MGHVHAAARAALVSFGLVMLLASCGGGASGDSAGSGSTGSAALNPSSSSSSSSSASMSSSSSSSAGTTGSVTLNWTAPTENTDGTALGTGLAGYTIVFGESANDLSQSVAITNASATSYTFADLPSGTWYFSIVSVDTAGNESPPTNVVSATI